MKYVVIYLNQYVWPEVIAITSTLDEARTIVEARIAADPSDAQYTRPDEEPAIHEVSSRPFIQYSRDPGHESYFSYVIQEL